MIQNNLIATPHKILEMPVLKSSQQLVTFLGTVRRSNYISPFLFVLEIPETRKEMNQEAIVSSHKKELVQTDGRYLSLLKEHMEHLFAIDDPKIKGYQKDEQISLEDKLLNFTIQTSISQKDLSKMIGVLWELMEESNIRGLDKTLIKINTSKLKPEVFNTIARVLSLRRERLCNWNHFILKGCAELEKQDPVECKNLLDELYVRNRECLKLEC
jgi:hypothetical protein